MIGSPVTLILGMHEMPVHFFVLSLFGCLSESNKRGRRKETGSVVEKILLFVDDFLFIKDSAVTILLPM